MKTNNVVKDKSFAFAIRVVRTYQNLATEKREYIMSKQLLKSGTSIGANVEEAIGAQSKRDFYAKMTIAYKEDRESIYWIRLLLATEYLVEAESQSLISDAEELCRIIGSIQVSTKRSMG
jgi:four helix bundle protein